MGLGCNVGGGTKEGAFSERYGAHHAVDDNGFFLLQLTDFHPSFVIRKRKARGRQAGSVGVCEGGRK